MDYNQFRNLMREWVREQVASDQDLSLLDLVVPNETSSHGDSDEWLRYSLQTSQDSETIGTGGPGQRLSRRFGRVFVEVFGPKGVGEGAVSQRSAKIETMFRLAMPAESPTCPDRSVHIQDPSTFERPEADKYCQVVSVPVYVDIIS